MNRNSSKKAFTLVEMLVVVAIIGMLASLIFGGLITSARAKARDARRIADLANIQSVLELYYSKFGFYPEPQTNWEDFTTILTGPEIGIGISKVPKEPLASVGKTYYYGRSTDGQDYVLGAVLETKDPTLDDDFDGIIYGVDCGPAVGDMIYCIKP